MSKELVYKITIISVHCKTKNGLMCAGSDKKREYDLMGVVNDLNISR